MTLLLCEPKEAIPERDGGSGTRLAELVALGWSRDRQGCSKFKWKNLITSPGRRAAGYFFFFFPERERRRAGIDLSSLPISLKFQINKIHFSALLPSPLQQTKEKQFPAVCSKLLSSLPHPAPLPFQTLDPSKGWETPSSEGTQREHPGASKTALTAQGAAFPAPPSMGFAGSQQDPSGICCPHIPGQQRPATPRAPKSNILSTKFPRVLKL